LWKRTGMTKIYFILRRHNIKQVDLFDKSWELAIEQEKSKKAGLFERGFLKQNLNKIINGKSNPTLKTLQKITVCINKILEERGIEQRYELSDVVGEIDPDSVFD